MCGAGFAGADCNELACPTNAVATTCSNRGVCNGKTGKCACHDTNVHFGDGCEHSKCPNDCSNHGTCDTSTGVCDCKACDSCEFTFEGDDCSIQTCKDGCNGHGNCLNGLCKCHDGFTGDTCHVKQCPNDCSGNGFCTAIDSSCVCFAGFQGLDCSNKTAAATPALPAADSATICSRQCAEVCISHASSSDIDKCHNKCHDCCLGKVESGVNANNAADECVEGIKAGVLDQEAAMKQ